MNIIIIIILIIMKIITKYIYSQWPPPAWSPASLPPCGSTRWCCLWIQGATLFVGIVMNLLLYVLISLFVLFVVIVCADSRSCLMRCYVSVLRPDRISLRETYGQSPYYDSGSRRVRLKQNLNFEGWHSNVQREFPGIVESTNLSRDNLSRETGRTPARLAAV